MWLDNESVLTQAQAIRDALLLAMSNDSSIIVTGDGVSDPRGVFTTTVGLADQFSKIRVFDAPLSENCITGTCIGAAMAGLKPVLVFPRIEFALLAFDQLINNAANWRSIFGEENPIPVVIRIVFGKGRGVLPNHACDLQSLFANIPGLKTVMPTTAFDAKGLLLSAIEDPNPVVFLEHRNLHDTSEYVPQEHYNIPLHKAEMALRGKDITVAAFSYSVVEALSVAAHLRHFGVELEVVNMRCVNPLDIDTLCQSVKKTGRLIVADASTHFHGVAAQIVSKVVENSFLYLAQAPIVLECNEPDPAQTEKPYLSAEASSLLKAVVRLCRADSSNSISLEQVLNHISDNSTLSET